jgi:4-hydroxy-4-methyl-2-oxoglutarate aldolase
VDARALSDAFHELSTPLIADACLRLKVPFQLAPDGVRPVTPGMRAAGRVLPARHAGSVDVFLEAMERARTGDVLVVDNAGRQDEACLLVWGLHRDTLELVEIGFPVFSYGRCPTGPRRLDPLPGDALTRAGFGGGVDVDAGWAAFADDDGVVFAPSGSTEAVIAAAREIQARERKQADAVRAGTTLRRQLRFDEYLRKRASDSSYTLRHHLQEIGGAIEV